MTRVVLATATYRNFEFHYGVGLMSLGWPSDDAKARLAALDVEITPAAARGYGGGRNFGQLFCAAIDIGADHVLTIDSDMRWTADHVVRLLEGERFLRSVHGTVVVGACYPQSKDANKQLFCEMRDGTRLPMHDGSADYELAARLQLGVDLKDVPDDPRRYAESWLLPAGFVLWPVSPFRTCAASVGEHLSAREMRLWDNAMCDVAMAQGARLFMDLSLDVGHMPLEPVSSVQRMAELCGLA